MSGVEASWLEEYQYRHLFHMTHEEFMDEPGDAIAWLIKIDTIRRQVEAEKNK